MRISISWWGMCAKEIFWRVVSILLFVFGGLWISFHSYSQVSSRLSQSYHFLFDIEVLGETLAQAESTQRGYILSDGPDNLERYREFVRRLHSPYRDALLRARDRPSQLEKLSHLESIAKDRINEMNRVISLVDRGSRETALQEMKENQERGLTQSIQQVIHEIRQEEIVVIESRLEYMSLIRGIVPVVLLLLCGSTIGMVLFPRQTDVHGERIVMEMGSRYREEFDRLRKDLGLGDPAPGRQLER